MKSIERLLLAAVLLSCLCVGGVGSASAGEGWPRQLTASGQTLTLHQPQVDSWQDYSKLQATMVVETTRKADAEPVLGAVWLECDTVADLDARLVTLQNFRITRTSFPSLDQAASEQMTSLLRTTLPSRTEGIHLDRILAGLERSKATERTVKGNSQPPRIFVSEKPAILVIFDGEPAFYPISENELHFAVNTNWDVLLDVPNKRYYLLNEDTWLSTRDLLQGPWTVPTELPRSFSKIPADENWQPVRAHLDAAPRQGAAVPSVFVSKQPAELIVVDGKPQLTPIQGTRISAVSNTDADLYQYAGDGRFYALLAGRWFRSKGLTGPWSPVGKDLPSDFARIPADGPQGHVLASVPGTPDAEEALIRANIPQRAKIRRNQAKCEVEYNGEPKFEPIQGTSLKYAVNTPSVVIRVGDRYYACEDGVWFVSSSPKGPWQVADSVPQEIYRIPESSPVYHASHVYVYDSDSDEVEFGYTSGYMGAYDLGGYLVFGTGYYYRPYFWPGFRPIYWPRPFTYGMRAHYNPITGTFSRGVGYYGPFGGAGRGAVYNPRTGTYFRGAVAYGPNNAAYAGLAYSPSTGWHWVSGTVPRGGHPPNPYLRWGGAAATVGAATAAARRGLAGTAGVDRARPGAAGIKDTPLRPAPSERPSTGKHPSDLYVGKDGQIYGRSDKGWSQYGKDGAWKPVQATTDAGKGSGDRDRLSQAKQQQVKLKDQAAQHEKPPRDRARPQEQPPQAGKQRAADHQKEQPQQVSKQRTADPPKTSAKKPASTENRKPKASAHSSAKRAPDVVGGLERDHEARSRGEARVRSAQSFSPGAGGGRMGGGGGRRR
ncbi:MAG: hypothetical protein AB1646_06025 [Thermodesulfobacteriota bacterium]